MENAKINFSELCERLHIKSVLRIVYPAVIVAVIIVFILSTVVLKGSVRSTSMESTLVKGDTIIGFRLAYLYKIPERGDVVVFESGEYDYPLVKRVIGLPGDIVELVSGVVYINGERLVEPYATGYTFGKGRSDIFYVPDGCVFLLGDNREQSDDARIWETPYVPIAMIRARVLCKYSPVLSVLFNPDKQFYWGKL